MTLATQTERIYEELPQEQAAIYTRYCAAPPPRQPIGEPRFIHAFTLAAWVGRVIHPVDSLNEQQGVVSRSKS